MESVVVYCKDIHKYFCEKGPAERGAFQIRRLVGHQPGQPAMGGVLTAYKHGNAKFECTAEFIKIQETIFKKEICW
jgi:hypothetical protein